MVEQKKSRSVRDSDTALSTLTFVIHFEGTKIYQSKSFFQNGLPRPLNGSCTKHATQIGRPIDARVCISKFVRLPLISKTVIKKTFHSYLL